ncbi:chemotaxis protein CheW [Alkalimarinus sediminis]|uniref:Chemotaxis protein CheW n=1 Tax=Alkalimarinus sediminis TaxID=1632866 RepID=A0A9E8HUG4_9ALTE|nr:chemotaxis protein CheW [Alkalimarinus sediminis]UZW76751.1 chemotaxis protein CheW [Alkalimarinus sediminis]
MAEQQNDNATITSINEEISDAIAHEPTEQYLTFFIDNEEYGVDILSVQEIRGWEPATEIPNAPVYLKGVINLRGTVVPITDLRLRFGINQFEYSPVTVVIVVKVKAGKSEKIMGIVVDAVSDVSNFTQADIHPAPELADNKNTAFIKGLGSSDNKMVILLDINKLLNAPEDVDLTDISRALVK